MTSENKAYDDKPAHAGAGRGSPRGCGGRTGRRCRAALRGGHPGHRGDRDDHGDAARLGRIRAPTGSVGQASRAPDGRSRTGPGPGCCPRGNGASIASKSAAGSPRAPATCPGLPGGSSAPRPTRRSRARCGSRARSPRGHARSGPFGSAWTGNFYLPPATTTGKVFFTTHDGGNWVCSASTVNSTARTP